jgi:hypothetical protein
MNAEKMHAGLDAFAEVAGGDSRRAELFRALAKVFEGLGTAKVAVVVTTIEANWKANSRVPCHPSELKKAVFDLQNSLARVGANAQAGAFASLLRLFVGSTNQSTDDFVVDAIAARLKQSRPRAGAQGRAVPFTRERARELADLLTAAADDRKRFDNLIDQIGSLKLADLKIVSGFYTGHETSKKKKEDVIKAIRNWHRGDELNRDRHAAQGKSGL